MGQGLNLWALKNVETLSITVLPGGREASRVKIVMNKCTDSNAYRWQQHAAFLNQPCGEAALRNMSKQNW